MPQCACECDAQAQAQRRYRVRYVTLRALGCLKGCNPRERQAPGVRRSFFMPAPLPALSRSAIRKPRYDQILSREINARSTLELRRAQFEETTGAQPLGLDTLAAGQAAKLPEPEPGA